MTEIDLTADRSIKTTVTQPRRMSNLPGAYHFAERRGYATVGLAGVNMSQSGNSLCVNTDRTYPER